VRDWFRDNQPVAETGYATTLLGTEAVKLIERHDPKTPLFLYLTFTAPHAPYQAPQEYLERIDTMLVAGSLSGPLLVSFFSIHSQPFHHGGESP